MATSRSPEHIASILSRAGQAPGDEAEEIRQLSIQANQAREDFTKAGRAFACISEQLCELQMELMRAALDMHNAKVRADKAVASVKEKAGLI